MMTIKHVTALGNESVIETDEESYTPADSPQTFDILGTARTSTGTDWWRSAPTAELVPIRDGDVYVMNGHGSTVARYHLGGWAFAE